MELSKYVFYIKKDERVLLINLINGITIIIGQNEFETIDDKRWDLLQINHVDTLKKHGFLVEKQELFIPSNDNYLALNINLTNGCNFLCDYCYFRANNSGKIIETINEDYFITWLSRILEKYNRNIYIDYLGGEPLLESKKLIYISNKVKQIATSKNKLYVGEVTSNGYFLNSSLADQLVEAGIQRIQVTFDGGPLGHNATRHNKSGEGSYQEILSNISKAKNIIEIIVRINIHNKTDMNDIEKLLIDLKESGIENVYFSVIEKNHEHEKEIFAVTDNDSLELYAKAWTLQKKYGFEFVQKIPSILGNCIAKNKFGFTINYDGKMYLCPSTSGIKKYYQNDLYDFKYIEKNISSCKEECYWCKFYPICMGGCEKLNQISKTGKVCRKSYFEELLQLYFTQKYLS